MLGFFVMGQHLPLVSTQLKAGSAWRCVCIPLSAAQPALKPRDVRILLRCVRLDFHLHLLSFAPTGG